jgi:PIN domain nuclease of toxin-antitoxin system
MNILLDTQTLIWALEDETLISKNARDAIIAADRVLVSPISFYEIAIKLAIGKNAGVSKPIHKLISAAIQSGYVWLPLSALHISAYTQLPFFDRHRDPFDRMLLAIASADNLSIISSDHNFPLYNNIVRTIW